MIDWLWLIVAVALGYTAGRHHSKDDIPKELEHLKEHNKRLETDVSYYKDLCKWHAEQTAELKRKQ